VVLLAGLVTMAALASPASARYSDAKAIWGPVTVNGVSQFPLYRNLGVGILEMKLNWTEAAPTRPHHASDPRDPAYQWPAEVNDAVAVAARYRIRIMLQVIGTPPWANRDRPLNWAPTNSADLARFVTAAARKYPNVHLWMVWGEPNQATNFEPEMRVPPLARTLTRAQADAPHKYAQMLEASYTALKAVSRRNLVIGGNTYTVGDISTRQWIENLRLPDGKPPQMDLYGHNPFSFRKPDLDSPPSPDGEVDFSDLGRLSQLVDHYLAPPGGHSIRLFLSEWTIPTGPDNLFGYYVTPALQAQWITAAWRIVRRSPFIYALGWINVYDDPPASHGTAGGLLNYRGSPKPGYYAFRAGW
jgi:hypothetical protein